MPDGLNLYHGLRDASVPGSRWLDVVALANRMLDAGEEAEIVRYFNAPAPTTAKRARQAVYHEALEANGGGLSLHLGSFKKKYWSCTHCAVRSVRREEKQTDVAIGSHLINDLHTRDFDIALLITGDADIIAGINIARSIRDVSLRAAFPPRRASADLKGIVDDYRYVRQRHIAGCLLPNPVSSGDGNEIAMPAEWQVG